MNPLLNRPIDIDPNRNREDYLNCARAQFDNFNNQKVNNMSIKTATKLALASFILSGTLATPAFAADDGKALYTAKLCATCHGDEGKAPILSSYPKLDGQNKEYLVAQIQMIKDGTRAGGGTAAMKAMIATLTDAEIEAISQYLSEVE